MLGVRKPSLNKKKNLCTHPLLFSACLLLPPVRIFTWLALSSFSFQLINRLLRNALFIYHTDVVQNGTLETYVIALTIITPINLILKKD